MFLMGKIKSYNDARGFGFIAVEGGSEDVFFHITDFPSRHIEPAIGETVKFRIVEDDGREKADQMVRLDLKQPQSEQTSVVPQQVSTPSRVSPRYEKRGHAAMIVLFLMIAAVLAAAVYGYLRYQEYSAAQQHKAQQLIQQQQQIVNQQREALGDLPDEVISEQGKRNLDSQTFATTKPRSVAVTHSIEQQKGIQPAVKTSEFKCDERQHCSQMGSRAEANWYIQNCSNHKMDGDGDGIPCENDSRW